MTGPDRTDPHVGEALSAYLDDELAPAARREADLHLGSCPHCQAELAEVSESRAAVTGDPFTQLAPIAVHAGLGR